MRDVAYEGRTWQVPNHFFPLLASNLLRWTIGDAEIALLLTRAEERFAARWLANHALSNEARSVVRCAESVWRCYFAHLNLPRLPKFRIATWDAGWRQAHSAHADAQLGADEMAALKSAHEELKTKPLPQPASLGFLS
jgi:hypothetical protein